MSERMNRARAQMRARFLSRAGERVVSLGNLLLALEARPQDAGLAEELMREVHTLKGEAKLMQLGEINAVAHEVEELILAAHALGMGSAGGAVQSILGGFDVLRLLVELEQGAAVEKPDSEAACARLRQAVAALREARPDVARVESPRAEAPETDWLFRAATHMRVDPAKLDELGKVSAQLLLSQQAVERSLNALMRRVDAMAKALEQTEAQLSRVTDPARENRELLAQVITQASQAARAFPELRRLARREAQAARERVFQTSLAQDEIQVRLRDLRLEPVSSLFERFPRAARDLAVAQDKRLRVDVQSTEVSIDKRILERLAEPMLHIVRNAIDHGIELPAEREAAGKPATALLTLGAEQVGSTIDIIIKDDGRGIDTERVRARATQLGLVTSEAAAALTPGELTMLIFRPGFSTREIASDVSGRGVGLDAAARTIADLGGSIRVHSEPGKGTRFVLTVPGSVLLKPVLLLRVGGQEFAFAAQRVDQVAHLASAHVESVGSQQAIRIDGKRLPLADLAQLLAVPSEPDEDRRVVVISSSGRTVALLVDSVLGQSQVLQRPVGLFMAGNTLLEAVVITASQNAVLLLSADRIVDMTEARRASAAPVEARASTHHSILVVDDSEVTRELIASILRHEGFEVVEAVNGKDALDRLRANRPAVVLSDLEMPLLDGIGLLGEIRRSAEFADLPFIMLTTRGSESDKRRGAEAGASAYLVKGNFDEDELLITVRRFLHQEAT